jgi:hypothetical protein
MQKKFFLSIFYLFVYFYLFIYLFIIIIIIIIIINIIIIIIIIAITCCWLFVSIYSYIRSVGNALLLPRLHVVAGCISV